MSIIESTSTAQTFIESKAAGGRESSADRQAKAFAWRFAEAERLAALSPSQRLFYADLCGLRARQAFEAAVPAYRILTNKEVLSLAEALPSATGELAILPLSAAKIRDFGAEIVRYARIRAGLMSQ